MRLNLPLRRSAIQGYGWPISVAAVIPLYNGAKFIGPALHSVISQTEPPDEVIVVDDGSTDNGAEMVRTISARFQEAPIKLLRQPNAGQSKARNFGIKSSKSTYIALLDQDDMWLRDHLAILKRGLMEGERQKKIGVVYGDLDGMDFQGLRPATTRRRSRARLPRERAKPWPTSPGDLVLDVGESSIVVIDQKDCGAIGLAVHHHIHELPMLFQRASLG